MSLHLAIGIIGLVLGAMAFETAGERVATHYFRDAAACAVSGILYLAAAALFLSSCSTPSPYWECRRAGADRDFCLTSAGGPR